jgi:catechol 2,3-dioxygenase-like lactoylglutathione lyase family enzyme
MNHGDSVVENSDIQRVMAGLQDCITGIDHVAVAVVDLKEAVDWYVNKLGFHLMEERETRGARTTMLSAVVAAGTAIVVLIQGTTPESPVCRFIEKLGPGVQHIAFGVKDMDEAMDRVVASGGATDTPLITDVGIRQAFLRRDPGSAVRVELIERTGGSFSDNTVQDLYLAFEAADLY